jgi:hypothetical protein
MYSHAKGLKDVTVQKKPEAEEKPAAAPQITAMR